jgi:hypothetical protein
MKRGAGEVTLTALALPFPMRPDFLAQIVVPRDMTQAEADRLCALVQSLVFPVMPPCGGDGLTDLP